MNRITIQRPTLEDKENIRTMLYATIAKAFAEEGVGAEEDDVLAEVNEKMNFLDNDYRSEGEDHFWLIAKDGEQIVGTIAFGPSGELIVEGSKGALKDHREIGSVMVHPDYQKRGIGMVLFNAMLLSLSMKGVESFILDSGYTRAKKIWTKLLGEPTYIMKDQWGPGHDHLIWYRRIETMTPTFYCKE